MGITKACIVEKICATTGLNKSRSAEVFENLLETIKHTLESGEDILIRGFGKFSVRDNNGRKRANSPNSEALALDVMRIVVFKSSPALIKKINKEEGL